MLVVEKLYCELIDDMEGFYDYFYELIVVNEIGLINIGSWFVCCKVVVCDKFLLCVIFWVFGWV